MNDLILKKDVQDFLHENMAADCHAISLKKSPFEGISSAELAQQLKGLQTAKIKFPFLYKTSGIYYPPSVNLEQASSETTANYKSKLTSGNSLIDLTAGMGIDAFAFAKNFEKVTALEKNTELAQISKYNYKILNQSNLQYITTDFEQYFAENQNLYWDVIYLDPSRRSGSQRKFLLKELEPDITGRMDEFLQRSSTVMLKLSPLSDLKQLMTEIPNIDEIHIVAVKNEVKELIVICKVEPRESPTIIAVNLLCNHPVFTFKWEAEKTAVSDFSDPLKFIYEPNSALMKSGAFQFIGQKFQLKKLAKSTHLYTSDEIINNFPGKIFEISETIHKPKNQINNESFHVISKNYPLSVKEIRQKFNLRESETQSLIFTQSIGGKHILKCRLIRLI